MHRFMECFDFTKEDMQASFDEQLKYMSATGMLSTDQQKRIYTKAIKTFFDSDVAVRMNVAAKKNQLYKEQPFVYGSDALELFEDETSNEDVILVQGIIDVFFKEDDGIVLLDYKTDRVDSEEELVLRYEKQMLLYKSAIEKAYNIPVKEMLLYSFALSKTIGVNEHVR